MTEQLYHQIAVLAAQAPGPRGDNPSELGGILIIAGIVAAVVLLALAGYVLATRFGRTRAEVARRRPYPPGRVGRSSEPRPRR
jgi:hypothetical protein